MLIWSLEIGSACLILTAKRFVIAKVYVSNRSETVLVVLERCPHLSKVDQSTRAQLAVPNYYSECRDSSKTTPPKSGRSSASIHD